jgi:hypothetical protein
MLNFQRGSERIPGGLYPVKGYYCKLISGKQLTTYHNVNKPPDDEPF